MSATVSIHARVPDPQAWVAEAHLRSGNLFAGMPADLVPEQVRGISVQADGRSVSAQVEADTEGAAFWRLVDYATFLSLPTPAFA